MLFVFLNPFLQQISMASFVAEIVSHVQGMCVVCHQFKVIRGSMVYMHMCDLDVHTYKEAVYIFLLI